MSFLCKRYDLGDIYDALLFFHRTNEENGRVQEFSLLDLKLIDHLALQC